MVDVCVSLILMLFISAKVKPFSKMERIFRSCVDKRSFYLSEFVASDIRSLVALAVKKFTGLFPSMEGSLVRVNQLVIDLFIFLD